MCVYLYHPGTRQNTSNEFDLYKFNRLENVNSFLRSKNVVYVLFFLSAFAIQKNSCAASTETDFSCGSFCLKRFNDSHNAPPELGLKRY